MCFNFLCKCATVRTCLFIFDLAQKNENSTMKNLVKIHKLLNQYRLIKLKNVKAVNEKNIIVLDQNSRRRSHIM